MYNKNDINELNEILNQSIVKNNDFFIKKNIIYLIKNNINNKVYIGKTVNSFYERWTGHLTKAKKEPCNSYFYRAIKKYGKENFSFYILESLDNPKNLFEREIFWIAKFSSKEIGYNSTIDGEGIHGRKLSEETKNKIRKGNIGKKYLEETRKKQSESAKGKPKSKEHRENLSKSKKGKPSPNKGRTGENNPLFGKPRSQETKDKISSRQKKTSIEKYSLDGIFLKKYDSISDACFELFGERKGHANIIKCCKNQRKKAYGFIWKYSLNIKTEET